MHRLPLIILTMIAVTSPLFAEEAKKEKSKILEFRPIAELGAASEITEGPGGKPAIKITGSVTPTLVSVIICDSPEISTPDYVVRGRIKYEQVAAISYLELWNDFGQKGQYFSRTLGDGGPMGKLIGTSDWHEFKLPFHANPGMKPEKLTLNVVLQGPGIVVIEQPQVHELSDSYFSITNTSIGAWLGGILGAMVGVWGAVIGITASLEKFRKWSLAFSKAGLVFSGILFLFGICAFLMGQSYEIYYPLMLVGFIGLFVIGFNLRSLSRRFRDDELRRMAAVDAG